MLDTLLIDSNINRFKRHPNAGPAPMSEFYSNSYWASVFISIPAIQNSDRFRQEFFCSVFVSRQPELNLSNHKYSLQYPKNGEK